MDFGTKPNITKVIIVEDEPSIAELYTHVLEKEGMQVKVVAGAVEALSALQTETFNIMLLDLMMPKVNGLEFLKSLQIYKKNSNMKIIIVSNIDQESVIKQAYELGAQNYMVKADVAPAQLVQVVKTTLNPESSPTQQVQGERKKTNLLGKLFSGFKKT